MKTVLVAAISFAALCVPAVGQRVEPAQIKEISSANSLISERKQPFYIKIAFQMFDLSGKPVEEGTVEEWWVSPGSYRLEIVSPSLKVTVPAQDGAVLLPLDREKYLVDRLLREATDPMQPFTSSALAASEVDREVGQTKLACYVFTMANNSVPDRPPVANICINPQSRAIRYEFEDRAFRTVRNSLGIFNDTNVALDLQVAYQGTLAITGKVESLQSFDHSKSDVVLSKSLARSSSTSINATGLTVGKVINKPPPVYPPIAKASRTMGAVTLYIVISKDGTIKSLFPLATASPMLVDAAMDAVKRWTYQPSLLDGVPTEVNTTVTVNFNLNKAP